MDTTIINIIEKECGWFYNNKSHKLQIESLPFEKWSDVVKKICSNNDMGILSIGFECLYEDKMFHILELIQKYNNNFKFHSSTICSHEFATLPYTNVSTLHATQFKNDIDVLKQDYNIFVNGKVTQYPLDKHIFLFKNIYPKTNPYILSTRRWNRMRSNIMNNLNLKNVNGIVRFLEFDNPNPKINSKNNLYVNTHDLIKEYSISYISFILETCVDPNRSMGYFIPMTEKTLIAFSTKTLPFVFGCKGLNKKLNEMGFWTANSLFDFDDERDDETKFIKLVHMINNMSLAEVENLYFNNIEQIEENYNLLNKLFDIGRKNNIEYLDNIYL